VRHRLGLVTRTQISVCKSPFPSAGTAVSLLRAKTVQQRLVMDYLKISKLDRFPFDFFLNRGFDFQSEFLL